MNRDEFSNNSMITGNEHIKELINFLLDKVEEKGMKYFISVRNGADKGFTLKAESDSSVIVTIEPRKYGFNLQLNIKCAETGDINENILGLIQKTYFD
ncbi:MAG: hypothetical protein LBR74_02445 [Eubacterium sp.]|jgi:hypothetical protein|nr:hypothetical protein [Eubacterium sp.]